MTKRGKLMGRPATSRTLSGMLWVILGASVLLAHGVGVIWAFDTVVMLAFLCVAFGVWGLLHNGGPQITAAGLFSAGTGAFGGYAGIWWANHLREDIPYSFIPALASIYFTVTITYHVMWWRPRVAVSMPEVDRGTGRWATHIGLSFALVSTVGVLVLPDSADAVLRAGAICGVLFVAAGISGGSLKAQGASGRFILLVLVFAGYVTFVFGGLGRLVVVALLAGVGMLLAERHSRRTVKVVAIVAVPLVAGLLTLLRSWRLHETLESDPSNVDSDVSGLEVFVRLIDSTDSFQYGLGRTFFSTAVAAIPRDWWPGKPVGFGFELTLLFEPQYAPAGHSMVATVYGEWFYNFGWYGMPILMLTLGPAIRWLDQWRLERASVPMTRRVDVVNRVFVALATSSVLHLVWSGTHTYVSRMLYATGVLAITYMICWFTAVRNRRHTDNVLDPQTSGRKGRVG